MPLKNQMLITTLRISNPAQDKHVFQTVWSVLLNVTQIDYTDGFNYQKML
jgi:hypothetical protein